MMRSPVSRFLLSGAALLALCISPLSQADDKPLIQAGKKTLFQRVLTTPGCKISPSAGGTAGDEQPVFSRFYVYERAQAANAEWLKVGPDSYGKTIGWLPASCTTDWKMQLTRPTATACCFSRTAPRSKASLMRRTRSAKSLRYGPP